MSDSVKIIFDAQTALKAKKDVEKLHEAIGELSSANPIVSALTSDFSKLGAVFELTHPKLARFGQGMVNVTAAVSGTIVAGAALAMKLAEMSAAFDQSQRAATLLGSAYSNVEQATNGTMSATTALRAQQSLVQSGLQVTASQLGVVARAARDYALATGVESTQAVEQLTDALRGGEAEGLRRFGLRITDTGDRTRNFEQAITQLTTAQNGHAAAALTATESLERFKTGLTHVAGEAASFLGGAGLRLLDWFSRTAAIAVGTDLQGGVRALISEIGDAPGVAAHNANSARQTAAGDARRTAREARNSLLGRVFRDGRMPDSALEHLGMNRLNASELESVARRADPIGGFANDGALNSAIDAVLGERTTRANAARTAASNAAITAADRLKNDGGAGKENAASTGGSSSTRDAIRAYGRALSEAMLLGATVNPVGQAPRGANAAAWWTERTGWQNSVNQLARTQRTEGDAAAIAGMDADAARDRENAQTTAQGASDRGEASRADRFTRQSGMRAFAQTQAGKAASDRRSSFGGMAAEAAGFATNDDGTVKTFDLMNDSAKTLGQTIGTLKSGVAELFGTLASGTMSAGDAFAQFGLKMLKSLGDVFINQGVGMMFQGIGAMATGNLVGGGITLAAGVGLTALGAGMGGLAAAAAPSAGGAAAAGDTSRASSLSPKSVGGKGESGGALTVVVSSLVPSGVSDLARVREAGRQQMRTFQPDNNQLLRRMEY